MQGKHGHLSREQKQLALRLHAKGWRLVDIAKEIGCSAPMVCIMARTGRHVDAKPFGWQPRPGRLTIDEREQILLGINRGDTFTTIAEQLGRAVSTISREVKRGGGRAGYSAWHARERAREQARRPKPFKLASGRHHDDDRATDLRRALSLCLLDEYPAKADAHAEERLIVSGALKWKPDGPFRVAHDDRSSTQGV